MTYYRGRCEIRHRKAVDNYGVIQDFALLLLFMSMGETFSELRTPNGHIVYLSDDTWVWTAMVEWHRQNKTEEFGEKLVPVPLCPVQILHWLIWERTRLSAVRPDFVLNRAYVGSRVWNRERTQCRLQQWLYTVMLIVSLDFAAVIFLNCVLWDTSWSESNCQCSVDIVLDRDSWETELRIL
jgi:hypothetical protein